MRRKIIWQCTKALAQKIFKAKVTMHELTYSKELVNFKSHAQGFPGLYSINHLYLAYHPHNDNPLLSISNMGKVQNRCTWFIHFIEIFSNLRLGFYKYFGILLVFVFQLLSAPLLSLFFKSYWLVFVSPKIWRKNCINRDKNHNKSV